MKKMMIIAAMVSVILIPAQMEANNKVNNKPKVEFNNRKDFNNKKFNDKRFNDKRKFDKQKAYYKMNDFNKKKAYNKRKPNRPAVMVINRPAPRPRPVPPPPPVKVVYRNNPIAEAIELAALAAIIAN